MLNLNASPLSCNSSESLSASLVVINKDFYRPAEVELLLGDSTPARKDLGWSPKVSFDELVSKMVNYDIEEVKKTKS